MGLGGDIIAEVMDGSWLEYAVLVHFPLYAGAAILLLASLLLPRLSPWLLLIGAVPFVLWATFLFLHLDFVIILPAFTYLIATCIAFVEGPRVSPSITGTSRQQGLA